jgi:hypothetical protein
LIGWLFKTTRFTALAQVRAEVKRARQQKEFHMEKEVQSAATDKLWNQISPLLDEALAALGETDRQAVLLRFFENKSLAEVGNFLGIGEDTARKRISRALEKLHRHLSKRGVSSTTAIIAGAISANSVQAAPVALAKSVTAAAIAKGAAASGSTLTLIKGALKIMAWTKAQTAIVAGVVVLLVAGTTIVVVKKDSADALYEKIWAHPNSESMNDLETAPAVLKIHPTHYPNRGSGINTATGRSMYVNAGILDLVGFAYNFADTRMIVPDGLPSPPFLSS